MSKFHSKLWMVFAGIVFAAITAVFIVITLVWVFLFGLRVDSVNPQIRCTPIFILLTDSLLIGGIVAIFVGRLIIKPVQKISSAFDALSKGNFDMQISTDEKIEEIREMAVRFNSMVHDLSHMETLRSDFVVNVSHEFKTPIAAIEGYATLLQSGTLPKEKQDCYVEKILDNSRRLSNLSRNILTLSKLENQETVLYKKEYRLDEQLRKAILMLESKWEPKQIEFDLNLPRQMFYGNEPLLDQVWVNLLDNAIKYTPDAGVIHVAIKAGTQDLSVTVADSGDGMSEEVQKHIFEKFYQGDPSRKSEGNGLGLALVQRIVYLCQGTILVKSSPGEGAAFTVRLPVLK